MTKLAAARAAFDRAQQTTSPGSATITLDEAKQITSPISGVKLKFDALSGLQDMIDAIDARKLGAPGVSAYLKGFLAKNNGMTRVSDGLSDWDRSRAITNAIGADGFVDQKLATKVPLAGLPTKLQSALSQAKTALTKELSPAKKPYRFDGFYEVKDAAGKLAGYAAAGSFASASESVKYTALVGFAPDCTPLFNSKNEA
jgi:hypothetical protein